MHAYAKGIQQLFRRNANARNAGPMKRYMRDQFEYLGIKTPQMSGLMKEHRRVQGLPPLHDLDAIVRDLWALPEREFQYAASSLIGRLVEELPEEFIATLEFLLTHKSWWDTVDSLAATSVATHFRRYPRVRSKYLAKWRRSKNFWLRRTCLLFQLNYGRETDFPLLSEIIRENLGSKQFFINKAIGWALRQYSRVDERGVRRFVAQTALEPLSAREALKWLEAQKAKKRA